jgi:hypothetical protein
LAEGLDEEYWERGSWLRGFSGISHLRTATSIRQLIDGSSKTYLVGEKYIDAANYHTGESLGDNESMYAGFCTDLHRFSGALERIGLSLPPYAEPLSDHAIADIGIVGYARFGSAHTTGLNFVYADGSTHFVSFDINGEIHFRFGHRFDGGNPIHSLARTN